MDRGRFHVHILLGFIALLCLPLLGVWVTGEPIGRYLDFPPLTRYVVHPGFSWAVFLLIASAEAGAVAIVMWAVLRARHGLRRAPVAPAGRAFPWWGWAGLAALLLSWCAAWTRFAWLRPLQHHTFIPLWLSYLVVVNGLCVARSGRSLLTHRSRSYLLLFPLSAGFWWFFEFLNRFVQNWYYVNVEHFSQLEYVVFATLSFATVLPAVMATRELLLTCPSLGTGLTNLPRVPWHLSRRAALTVLFVGALGMLLLGVFPTLLFPLVWVAPLFLLVAVKALDRRPTVLDHLRDGDWREVIVSPLAALICGFFWELWNWQSLAHWEYSIPFVDRFKIFEMPLLGYGGYLPFGLECTVVATLVMQLHRRSRTAQRDPAP